MRSRIIIALFALATIPFLGVVAQVRLDSCEFAVDFKYNSTAFFADYCDNAKALAALDEIIRKTQQSETLQLQRISVKGYSSPDGIAVKNIQLSNKRRDALLDYLRNHYNLPDNMFDVEEGIIAWDKLHEMVKNGEDFKGRDRALEIIADNSAKNYNSDTRRMRLKRLNRGFTWMHLSKNYFPQLRKASFTVFTLTKPAEKKQVEEQKSEEQKIVAVPKPQEEKKETAVETQPLPESVPNKPAEPTVTIPASTLSSPFTIALSTNLLYDLAAIPNIGLEIPVSDRLSLKADWMYAWWSQDAKHRYWRIYGGDIALRYYLKPGTERFLSGHHLGLFAQMTTYDFELGGRGYQAPRWQYGGGVEYGYSMPIAKRLNLDFSLTLGYLTGTLSEYVASEGHYYEDIKRTMHYFGPTSAQVSLVWLIPFNATKKGGER